MGETARRQSFAATCLLMAWTIALGAADVHHTHGRDPALDGAESIDTRIINGENVPPSSFPWIVPIVILRSATTYSVFCSGVVAGSNRILTAAHCIFDEDDTRRYAWELRQTGIVVEVAFYRAQSAVHAGWNPRTYENDVAVLTVAGNFSYLLNDIVINVADPNFAVGGADLAVYRYGVTEWGRSADGQLRTFDTFLNGESTCQQYALKLRIRFLPQTEFCFGSTSASSRPCVGDSGGGIFGFHNDQQVHILVGQTIYGAAECEPFATFASRASGFTNFFLRNLNVCPCTADRNCVEPTNAPYLCPKPLASIRRFGLANTAMTITSSTAVLMVAILNNMDWCG